MIEQLAPIGAVGDNKICTGTWGQDSRIFNSHGSGGPNGHRAEGLFRGHTTLNASQSTCQEQVRAHGRPGIVISRERGGKPNVQKSLGGREIPVSQEEGGGGQEHRHHPGVGQQAGLGGAGVVQVIGADGTQFGGQGATPRGAHLLGVDLEAQAQAAGALEDAASLGGAEGALLHEHVGEVGQAPAGHLGQHLLKDDLDVGLGVRAVLGGDHVGPQEGAAHIMAEVIGQAAADLQEAQFAFGGEAVAAFGLHAGDALGQQMLQAVPGQAGEVLHTGGAGGPDGGGDATTAAGDLLVADAAAAGLKVGEAIAGEDQMGVAVHQPGQHQGGLERLAGDLGGSAGFQGGAGTDLQHAAVLHQQGCIQDGPEGARLGVGTGSLGGHHGHQRLDAGEEGGARRCVGGRIHLVAFSSLNQATKAARPASMEVSAR